MLPIVYKHFFKKDICYNNRSGESSTTADIYWEIKEYNT